jgi:hypothetical protein
MVKPEITQKLVLKPNRAIAIRENVIQVNSKIPGNPFVRTISVALKFFSYVWRSNFYTKELRNLILSIIHLTSKTCPNAIWPIAVWPNEQYSKKYITLRLFFPKYFLTDNILKDHSIQRLSLDRKNHFTERAILLKEQFDRKSRLSVAFNFWPNGFLAGSIQSDQKF